MAYDFGSKGLGIKNPFKQEGLIRTLGGLAIAAIGLYSVVKVTTIIEQDMTQAWIYALVGLILLVSGLKRMGSGLFQLFKFFVGRSVPSSLSYNLTKSETENAELERKEQVLAYKASTLESMLMGRKNATFTEPLGWMGRFVHSIFPKLIFLPYPIRNISQEVVSVLTTSLIAFLAFGLTYFVSSSGLAGQAGHIIMPIFSIVILLYLVSAWRKAANAVSLDRVKQLNSAGAASVAKIITFSIVFPVVIGVGYYYLSQNVRLDDSVYQVADSIAIFSAWPSLFTLIGLGVVSTAFVFYLVHIRSQQSSTSTEVSEYRENLQESVHPNEIFINIENIVLANRRYKEIPNRTYMNFDPVLEEQSQGKGSFSGELLIETQPEYSTVTQPASFNITRLLSTALAQILLVCGAYLFFSLASQAASGFEFLQGFFNNIDSATRAANRGNIAPLQGMVTEVSTLIVAFVSTLFLWQIVNTIGRMLENFSHIFWAELQFNSLLMYMKTEGTFAESKISTGMSIHDSTRSENVIVKSSITPWVVSSRISSSTFATSGARNVEMPRYVMSMRKNDSELAAIVDEIKAFLRARENIAGFSNSADLQHAENILKVNNASRYNPNQLGKDDEAAGFLRNQPQVDSTDDESSVEQTEKLSQ
ncbi:hypothetical protein SAMN05216262_1128 [Colwellia chukchiensis]|uniref:Uncharacterized protein n=1 Tax=Colwellia chukchiensis TaxID=641665 RepID=A0A1H7QJS7_9GAMM|nr:hypothetical protein [Colwellia chukchiensis]SEL48370.1 hypothetical protein SAMN05216262_1128 [Colwellia chukchiensis]